MKELAILQSITDKSLKQIVRNEIISVCKIQFGTYYSWLARGRVPKWQHQNITTVLLKHKLI